MYKFKTKSDSSMGNIEEQLVLNYPGAFFPKENRVLNGVAEFLASKGVVPENLESVMQRARGIYDKEKYDYNSKLPNEFKKLPQTNVIDADSLNGTPESKVRRPNWLQFDIEGKKVFLNDQEINMAALTDPIKSLNSQGSFRKKTSIPPKPVIILAGTHGSSSGNNWDASGKRRQFEDCEASSEQSMQHVKALLGVLPENTRETIVIDTSLMSIYDVVRLINDPKYHVIGAYCNSYSDNLFRALLKGPAKSAHTNFSQPLYFD